MEQLTIDFNKPLPFGGQSFDAERDGVRLAKHLQRVLDLMKDGEKHTLAEIAEHAGCSQPSASARLRDLKKPWAGSHRIEKEFVANGVWAYWMEI